MKKYKCYKLILIIISVVIMVLVTSYLIETSSKNPNEPPKISISSNNIDIPYIIGKNIWNGSIYDRIDNFHTIMKDNTEETLKYIPIGQKIEVEFENFIPESIVLVDEVIDDFGNVMFINSSKEISITLDKGKGDFILDEHYATLLSSNSDAFKNGVLRGFRLICKWGENECEYSFVIKISKR